MHIQRLLKFKIIRYNFANINKEQKSRVTNEKNKKIVNLQNTVQVGIKGLLQERRLIKQHDMETYKNNLPSLQLMRQMKLRQCTVKLFMNHNQWKSQYIYAVMNYQKLGFIPITNYTLLKNASQFYHVSKKPQSQQFPIMKFSKPIQQPFVLHGIKQIIKFLDENQLIRYKIQNDQNLSQPLKKFIDQNIATNLQMLFWHPTLTFNSLFHTHMASYKYALANYDIFTLIYKNTTKICKNIPKNLIKIFLNKAKYEQSKVNLQKNLKQIIIILNNQQYLGGTKPSHLDFYLFSILNTKINVQYFQDFLRNSIGKQFWTWMFRMRCATKYDKQRMTIL